MTDTATPPTPPPTDDPLGVILSREEVLVILGLTGRTFPELSAEPIANLTDEQRAYGLVVAERALRARNLAILDEEGNTRINRDALRLVLGCTTNGDKVIVTRISAPSSFGTQASAHAFEGQWLLHSQPSAGLHAFQESGDWPPTWEILVGYIGYPAVAPTEPLSMAVSTATVSQARAAAEAGNSAEAQQLFVAAGAADEAATRIAALLSRPHIVTMIHVVRPIGDDAAIQSITTLHNEGELYVAVSPEGDEGPMVIQAVGLDALSDSVARMLTVPLA